MANSREDMDMSLDEELDQQDIFMSNNSLLVLWAAARDRSLTKNARDFHNKYLAEHDVDYSISRAIWQAAHDNLIAKNAKQFCRIFKHGLYAGRDDVISHELSNRHSLFLHAELGKYDDFVKLFNQGFVDINAVKNGETFLHALIRSDSRYLNAQDFAQGVARIAEFLLKQGASIDIPGKLPGESSVTVRQLLHGWQNNTADTVTNRLWYTLWADKPILGNRVYPVIQAHLNHKNQEVLLQQAIQQTNNAVEPATKRLCI